MGRFIRSRIFSASCAMAVRVGDGVDIIALALPEPAGPRRWTRPRKVNRANPPVVTRLSVKQKPITPAKSSLTLAPGSLADRTSS